MTDQATRVVPAGWYQDPAVTEQVRWWNGLAWTEHVRDKPSPAPVSAGGATHDATVASETAGEGLLERTADNTQGTTAERIAAARELERQFGIGTSENEIITGATALGFGTGAAAASAPERSATSTPGTESGSRPTGALNPDNPAVQRAAAAHSTGPRSHTTTGAAWLIALTPLLTVLFGLTAAYVFFYMTAAPVVFVIAVLIPYLLGLLWALNDGRTLRSRGFDPPGPWWALTTSLGYLILRRLRVPGSGPLFMFGIIGALAIALPAATYASGAIQPLSNALTIQNTISTNYLESGRAVSVSCPPFVDATTTGTLYSCSATLATGVVKQVWVSIDGPDGKFSYSMAF